MEINNESLTSTQLVSINLSDDRQYLMLTEKKVINLKAVDLLTISNGHPVLNLWTTTPIWQIFMRIWSAGLSTFRSIS